MGSTTYNRRKIIRHEVLGGGNKMTKEKYHIKLSSELEDEIGTEQFDDLRCYLESKLISYLKLYGYKKEE